MNGNDKEVKIEEINADKEVKMNSTTSEVKKNDSGYKKIFLVGAEVVGTLMVLGPVIMFKDHKLLNDFKDIAVNAVNKASNNTIINQVTNWFHDARPPVDVPFSRSLYQLRIINHLYDKSICINKVFVIDLLSVVLIMIRFLNFGDKCIIYNLL